MVDALQSSLRRVLETLERSREVLLGDARPAVATVTEASRSLAAAREALVRCAGGSLEGMTVEDRLAVVRLVEEVKRRAGVVARLLHGSAWFASLARAVDPAERPAAGTYGRDGARARAPQPSSVERKA